MYSNATSSYNGRRDGRWQTEAHGISKRVYGMLKLKKALYGFGLTALISMLATIALLYAQSTASSKESKMPSNLVTYYQPMQLIPSTPTQIYSSNTWLISIIAIPQSTTSPNCTVKDNATGTPHYVWNAAQFQPNFNFTQSFVNQPLYMAGGITWSCSDNTVAAQLIVQHGGP